MAPGSDVAHAGRVLVVDDQEHLCWVLSRLLRERGHVVHTASTGAQALRVAEAFPCQVAIVDYRLPDTSGLTLLARLQSGTPRMRGILMTSYGGAALRREASAAGLACFDKPFVNAHLVEAVETALAAWEAA
jgi:DNA-binding NtrC family response regulator